jgi:adenylyltransferase/sulfurtransferase
MAQDFKGYFDRQIKLKEFGIATQEILANKSVLIIGMGGLGCPVSMQLSGSGIGNLGIIDFDQVEFTNLYRQPIYEIRDVGKNKVDVAEVFLKNRNPFVKITKYFTNFDNSTPRNIIKAYDLILDCTDSFESRFLINDICIELNKPFITASIFRTSAQIAYFSPIEKICYRCLYPDVHNFGNLSCNTEGVLGVQVSLAAHYQVAMALEFLLESKYLKPGLLIQIDWNPIMYHESLVSKKVDCKCSEGGGGFLEDEFIGISAKDYLANPLPWVLLDIRNKNEREEYSIPNSIAYELDALENLEREELIKYIGNNKRYLILCSVGSRSYKAKDILQDLNIPSSIMSGGVRAFKYFSRLNLQGN